MNFQKIVIYSLVITLLHLYLTKFVYAFPYHPATRVIIETEGLFKDAENLSTKQYIIQTNVVNNKQETVFTASAGPGTHASISLIKFSDTIPVEIQKDMHSPGHIIKDTLYFATGYPVPLDILPITQDTPIKEYERIRSAGGRTFKQTITVNITPLTIEEAQDRGWLRISPPHSPTPLYLFTATTPGDKLLSRQLWPENGDWWLYEETPFRRSWRIK